MAEASFSYTRGGQPVSFTSDVFLSTRRRLLTGPLAPNQPIVCEGTTREPDLRSPVIFSDGSAIDADWRNATELEDGLDAELVEQRRLLCADVGL